MKKITRKKLLQYSAAGAPVILFGNVSEAQILYHNIDPDSILHFEGWPWDYGGQGEETMDIDMNADGFNDIGLREMHWKFNTDGYFYYSAPATIDPSPGWACAFGSEYFKAMHLMPGNMISSGLGWNVNVYNHLELAHKHAINMHTYYDYWTGPLPWVYEGPFLGKIGFVAIEKNTGTDHYYGWLRLSASDDAEYLRVQDYAFNTVANEPIYAGQTDQPADPSVIINVQIIGDTKAFVKWMPMPGATQYHLQVRKTGAAAWMDYYQDATKSSRKINLPACDVNYECRIAVIDPDGSSTFSSTFDFYAPACRIDPETNADIDPQIFPNPAAGNIHINFNQPDIERVEIFNASMQLVFSQNVKDAFGLTIDVASWSSGIYFARLTGNTGSSSIEFIKQ